MCDVIIELESLGYEFEIFEGVWFNIFCGNGFSNEIIFWLVWNFVEDGNNGGYV